MHRVVSVLGGNAFASAAGRLTIESQLDFAHRAAEQMAPLWQSGSELLISHGNGPQVGHILTRVEEALGKAYSLPLEVCVAESEGELGYVLEQAIRNTLSRSGSARSVASMLTQVEVAGDDPALEHPTKPVGPFFDRGQAEDLRRSGLAVCEDAGRGYRRVVPSPRPLRVLGIEVIRHLVETGVILIAAGGGGIPVICRDGQLEGVEAVIDKDWTAALLADQLDAELLVIVTAVPCAYRNFRTAREEAIGQIDTLEVERLLSEGHFAEGSMKPKIEAAIQFASRPGRRAIICDPPTLPEALQGRGGTIIQSERPEPDATGQP